MTMIYLLGMANHCQNYCYLDRRIHKTISWMLRLMITTSIIMIFLFRFIPLLLPMCDVKAESQGTTSVSYSLSSSSRTHSSTSSSSKATTTRVTGYGSHPYRHRKSIGIGLHPVSWTTITRDQCHPSNDGINYCYIRSVSPSFISSFSSSNISGKSDDDVDDSIEIKGNYTEKKNREKMMMKMMTKKISTVSLLYQQQQFLSQSTFRMQLFSPKLNTTIDIMARTHNNLYHDDQHYHPMIRKYNNEDTNNFHSISLEEEEENQMNIIHDDNNNDSNRSIPNQTIRKQQQEENEQLWLPMEGLFGTYNLPSGQIYVFIAKSEIIYQAPTFLKNNNEEEDQDDKNNNDRSKWNSWWTIRKITQLHIVHISHNSNTTSINNNNNTKLTNHPLQTSSLSSNDKFREKQQRQEEIRQLALLRQALKHHDWYYCTSNCSNSRKSFLIPDMTYNLQQSMLLYHHDNNNKSRTSSTIHDNNNINNMTKKNAADHDKMIQTTTSKYRKWFANLYYGSNDKEENNNNSIHDTICEILPWWEIIDPVHKNNNHNVNNATSTNSTTIATTKITNNILPLLQKQIRPDSRFFWNEELIEPLIQELKNNKKKVQHQQQDEQRVHDTVSNSSSTNNDRLNQNNADGEAIRTLLYHVIPVTSAFCAVQANLSFPIAPAPAATRHGQTASDESLYYYDEVLITRRSRFRAGTRFTRRGADDTGSVANYAETEQILFFWEKSTKNQQQRLSIGTNKNLTAVASYVQTRGSIPLRWSSPTDIKTYRPRIRIGTDPIAQARALFRHIADQVNRYCIILPKNEENGFIQNIPSALSTHRKKKHHPSLLLVNLIDKKSDQGRLGRVLDAVLEAVLDVYETKGDKRADPSLPAFQKSDIQHLWFDFHAEVKSGRWEKLATLVGQLKPVFSGHGYFRFIPKELATGTAVNANPYSNYKDDSNPFVIEKLQTGIIRTNCMDCLDRTNVVQSIFGRYILFQQIADYKKLRIPLAYKAAFRQSPMALPWPAGEHAHRLLWADNADAISRLYAGTPALKGDFTRTGKRTKKGAIDDGMNSLQRYYLNNFLDADRQEGIDLLVGHTTFSNLDDTLAGSGGILRTDDDESMPAWSDLIRQGMSVKEAARYMLLGIDNHELHKKYTGDRDHVRIKLSNRSKRKWDKLTKTHALDLRWLPGDLQTQFRSLTYPPSVERTLNDWTNEALQAIDRRSASPMPWWVVPDSSSDSGTSEEDNDDNNGNHAKILDVMQVASTNNNAGYVLSALVAGSQAPLTMAALVMGLVAVCLNIPGQ